jgi:hypothetical protein
MEMWWRRLCGNLLSVRAPDSPAVGGLSRHLVPTVLFTGVLYRLSSDVVVHGSKGQIAMHTPCTEVGLNRMVDRFLWGEIRPTMLKYHDCMR